MLPEKDSLNAPILAASSSGVINDNKAKLTRVDFGVLVTGLLIAYFLPAFDQTVVITALPAITADLGHLYLFGYVVSMYLVTSCASGPFFGTLSDRFGRRPVFLVSVLLFLGGSILCGVSIDMYMLIGSRALQGIGGGGISMLTQIIFADIMSPQERAKFASMTSLVLAVASVLGPLIGGILSDAKAWRWIFFLNIPVGVISAVLALKYLDYDNPRGDAVILDFRGSVLSAAAVSLLLLSIGSTNDEFWLSPVGLLGFGFGLVLLVCFFVVEAKVPSPVLPLRLFKIRNVAVSTACMFSANLVQVTCLSLFTLYFQFVYYDSARISGVELLPLLGLLVVSATLTGYYLAKTSVFRPFLVLGSVSLLVPLVLLHGLKSDSIYWGLPFSSMMAIGLGYGFIAPVSKVICQNAVQSEDNAAVTVLVIFARTLGGAIGSGLYGAIFSYRLHSHVQSTFGSDDQGFENLSPSQLRDTSYISSTDLPLYLGDFTEALGDSFLAMVPVVLVTLIPTLCAVPVKLKSKKKIRSTLDTRSQELRQSRSDQTTEQI
jgi:EmrB/QacA subfamily drug resistance transporter